MLCTTSFRITLALVFLPNRKRTYQTGTYEYIRFTEIMTGKLASGRIPENMGIVGGPKVRGNTKNVSLSIYLFSLLEVLYLFTIMYE